MAFEYVKSIFLPENILAALRTKILHFGAFYLDYWMLVHFVSGFILGAYFMRFSTALVFIVGFEIFERVLMEHGVIGMESGLDTLFDIIFGLGGFLLMRYLLGDFRRNYKKKTK